MTTAHRSITGADNHIPGYKQSGDPGAVGAGKVWHDTDDDKWYVRNAADSAWLQVYPQSSSLADGDKGDITVSSTGTVWTIDNDVVTYAKFQNVAAGVVLGRASGAGSGDMTELSASQVKTILALAQADITGLTTASTPNFSGIELGTGSTDTTLTRASAGDAAIEGNIVYRAGGTDVPVTDGGTGASSAATALSNLGGVPLSTIDAAGDLYIGSADNTVTRLAKGTANQKLEMDNSAAVAWKSRSGAEVITSATTTVGNTTDVAIAFDGTDTTDTDSYHNPASQNTRVTVPFTGWYQVVCNIDHVGDSSTAGNTRRAQLRKNAAGSGAGGTELARSSYSAPGTNANTGYVQVVWLGKLTASDYIEAFYFQNSGASRSCNGNLQILFMGA